MGVMIRLKELGYRAVTIGYANSPDSAAHAPDGQEYIELSGFGDEDECFAVIHQWLGGRCGTIVFRIYPELITTDRSAYDETKIVIPPQYDGIDTIPRYYVRLALVPSYSTPWKPIETAPKDGTTILIRGGNTGENIYDGDRALEQRPVTAFYKDSEWCIGYWDGDWRTQYEDPTEWCEVPA